MSEDGIGTDPNKIKTVTTWPEPTCSRDVRAFLGLAGYYRRFVKDFALMASPLNQLLKRGVFSWTEESQKAFEDLKTALTTPPVLAMPTDNDEFILDTDASDYAIGAVLSQRQNGIERVVAYASRALDRRERNYCVTRKELLAVVNFFKVFKQYLLGRHFRVRTDHAALSWLKRTPEPIGQQARWLEQMEEFDYVIEHRPGKSHGNADALSRIMCPKHDCVCRQDAQRQDKRVSSSLGVQLDTFGEPDDNVNSDEGVTPVIRERSDDESLNTDEKESVPLKIRNIGRNNRSADGRRSKLSPIRSNPVNSATIADTSDSEHNGTPTHAEDIILPWTLDGLRAAQRADAEIGYVIKLKEEGPDKPTWDAVALKSKDVKTLWNLWSRLSIRNGLLKRRFESPNGDLERWQVVWPKDSRMLFMEIAHGGMTGGHLGREKTAAAVQSRAYWPTWNSDLDKFMDCCKPCARYHRGAVRRQAPMQISLVGEPWERISVDITGPHPRSSRNNQYILTLVDHFSKWAEAIPISNHKAPTVARALMVHVFSRFGAPKQLLTDRGPEFESVMFAQLMQWMEIDKLRTTAYKPSTNGVVERFHRTLNTMLAKVVNDSQRDWDERLPLVMAAYRASPHSSTGFSPNKLFLGRDNRMPLDLLMGLPQEELERERSGDQIIAEMQERAEAAYTLVREQLRVSAERRKALYDIRVKEAKFSVGDWVWYHYPRRYRMKSQKWQKNYTGPFLIVRVIGPVNYVLQKSQKSKPFVVHTDKIKLCYGSTPASWLRCVEETCNDGSCETEIEQQKTKAKSVSPPDDSERTPREVSTESNSPALTKAKKPKDRQSDSNTVTPGLPLGPRPKKLPKRFELYYSG